MNSNRTSPLMHQTELDKSFKKSEYNNFKVCRLYRSELLPIRTDKEIASAAKILKNLNCTDLSNYIHKSWNNKTETVLLPTSEPQKTCIRTTNNHILTERKPVTRIKYDVSNSDLDESDLYIDENNLRNQRSKIQQKHEDPFINDEPLSNNNIENMHHIALTNPTNTAASKPMLDQTSVEWLQTIRDSDIEDENKSNNDSKILSKKRLSFSDDHSGDYVLSKEVTVKIPQSSEITSKLESATKNKSVKCKSFLRSLSNIVAMNSIHPNAKKYRLDYKNNKGELCTELYKLYNDKVFDNKLPEMLPIEWYNHLRFPGFCSFENINGVKFCIIGLATPILDTADKVRDILIHEMCHAAGWIINDVVDHEDNWRLWANKAMRIFPELSKTRPYYNFNIKKPISKCSYDFKYQTFFKFVCYRSFERDSEILDVEKMQCSLCSKCEFNNRI